MTEEKKEEIKEHAAAEAPKAEAAAQQQVPPGPAVKEEKKQEAPVKKERPANCEGCKKSIKKKRWYYRDGKYYCTKRCWNSSSKKAAKPEGAAPAS
jgi:hypothetical protein